MKAAGRVKVEESLEAQSIKEVASLRVTLVCDRVASSITSEFRPIDKLRLYSDVKFRISGNFGTCFGDVRVIEAYFCAYRPKIACLVVCQGPLLRWRLMKNA